MDNEQRLEIIKRIFGDPLPADHKPIVGEVFGVEAHCEFDDEALIVTLIHHYAGEEFYMCLDSSGQIKNCATYIFGQPDTRETYPIKFFDTQLLEFSRFQDLYRKAGKSYDQEFREREYSGFGSVTDPKDPTGDRR